MPARSRACTSWARTRRCPTRTPHHAREALAKLEHLVVQDIFLTETAMLRRRRAAGLGLAGEGRHGHQHQPPGADGPPGPAAAGRRAPRLVDHPGARPPHGPATGPTAIPREVFAEMTSAMPSLDNITWERLERESSRDLSLPRARPAGPRRSCSTTASRPPTGRGRLVPARSSRRPSCPTPSIPLVLTTGRQLEHWHTGAMTRRASVLDALEPEAIAAVDPLDLRRLGVDAGDMVRVATRRGAIELMARAGQCGARRRGLHPVLLSRRPRPTC